MSTPHKASAEQWANVEQAKDPIEIHPGVFVGDKNTTIAICILELRARVEALEEDENDRRFEQAKAIIDQPTPTPTSPLVEPSDIFPTEYADSGGDGIRIMMEPADETGRVCWVVRNSRHVNPCHEFPAPEAAYAAHKSASARQAVAATAPASSLVKQVAGAMGPSSQAAMDAGELPYGTARAALAQPEPEGYSEGPLSQFGDEDMPLG